MNFEIFLGNLSFVFLFVLMIFYWVQAIFSVVKHFNFFIFFTTLFANTALFVLLVIRWVNYGHFPLSNLYESLLFLSWSFTFIQLIFISSLFHINGETRNSYILKNFRINTFKIFQNQPLNSDIIILIGTVLSPVALFTNSFATFSLPKTMQKAQALVPALQSNWLMMHVTVMMLSYTALLCGSLLAITFLVITWFDTKNTFDNKIELSDKLALSTNSNDNTRVKSTLETRIDKLSNSRLVQQNEIFKYEVNLSKTDLIQNQNVSINTNTLAKTLDNLSYRILGIGFPLLTIGILSGAVWANEAWGSYWSWDPKETWAFITWLVFAIYLHTRITKGWEGEKPAILASFGFFIVWICYLGVNILGTGLHSYGWIQFKT